MRLLWILCGVFGAITSVYAEVVAHAAATKFDARPLACQSVSFGPDAGGFDLVPSRQPEDRYTAVLLTVHVTASRTVAFNGHVVNDPPPALHTATGVSTWLMKGTAESICPRLRQPSLRLRIVQHGCDTWPREGACLTPAGFRFAELDDD